MDFELADFVMVRTPLLPFERFAALASNGTCDAAEVEARRQLARRNLERAYQDPLCMESLRVASKSLGERASQWRHDAQRAKDLKTQHAMMRYFSRMSYRCTPFGLLAGVSWNSVEVGTADPGRSGILLAEATHYRKACRIDMAVVANLITRLLKQTSVRRALHFVANPTLHRRGTTWRYVEPAGPGNPGQFQMSVLHGSEYLDALLERCLAARTAPSFAELAHIISAQVPEAQAEEVAEFVDQLIESRTLLSTLEPTLTGTDPLDNLIVGLQGTPESDLIRSLREVQCTLRSLDETPCGSAAGLIDRATRAVSALVGEEITDRTLLQTDLHKPMGVAPIPADMLTEVKSAVSALLWLVPAASGRFDAFREAFRQRYGDAEVPLSEALDPDSGIPFGPAAGDAVPLLSGVQLPLSPSKPGAITVDLAVTGLLMRKVGEAWRSGAEEIVLTRADIEALRAGRSRPLPASFFALITLPGPKEGDVASDAIVLRGVGGSSGIPLIGRFCAGDAQLTQHVRHFLDEEEKRDSSDTIHAEIVHWPSDRMGNVILRPQLRKRELPLFGRPSVCQEDQIWLRDLLITVRNDKVVLRDRRSGKRVLPRLACAHNPDHRGISIYSFLGALARQDNPLSAFFWPPVLAQLDTLPRVRFGRCILHPRVWQLREEDVQSLETLTASAAYDVVQTWRRTRAWPRFVELVEGDNCLCIDLDNPLSVDGFAHELKDMSGATVREALVPSGSGFVRDSQGAFCHELVLPFLRTIVPETEQAPGLRGAVAASGAPLRRFFPGSSWLSLKVYAGTAGIEQILNLHLPAFTRRLVSEGLIRRWFFVRYKDADDHVRIRFHAANGVPPGRLLHDVDSFLSELQGAHLAWRATIDTYEPEDDRYGGSGSIGICEDLFSIDSECALRLLANGHLDDPEERWRWIACATDLFWAGAGYGEAARLAMYERITQGSRWRQVDEKSGRVSLDRKFRSSRHLLESTFADTAAPAHAVLMERTNAMRPLLAELRGLEGAGTLTRPLSEILVSLVHMSINRLCITKSSTQEQVIYAMLCRLLSARLARQRAAGLSPTELTSAAQPEAAV